MQRRRFGSQSVDGMAWWIISWCPPAKKDGGEAVPGFIERG